MQFNKTSILLVPVCVEREKSPYLHHKFNYFENFSDCKKMDEKFEKLEAKVDQIGEKLDLLIRHLVPTGLPLSGNTG